MRTDYTAVYVLKFPIAASATISVVIIMVVNNGLFNVPRGSWRVRSCKFKQGPPRSSCSRRVGTYVEAACKITTTAVFPLAVWRCHGNDFHGCCSNGGL